MTDENRKYFNMKIEPLLNTREMRKIQEEKLASTMRFFYDKVPFDRDRMDQAGVTPENIKSFHDLAKAIPITGQADFR
jgi:phenylacetate-CoA ligase